MAALFLADVAPQTGCILLPLWIVLCVFVESPIGAISSPVIVVVVVVPFLVPSSSSTSTSSSTSSFASSATFRFSQPSLLYLFHPSSLSALPLLAIDRQKSHGGIVKARREGTAPRLAPWIYPPPKLEHFSASCQPKGEPLKHLEVIQQTCAKSTTLTPSSSLFVSFFYPHPTIPYFRRNNEFLETNLL